MLTAMSAIPRPLRAMRQTGLTLVELMVALALGLFLTLGLMLMMSDSSRTFKIQDDYARMQENAVSGLRYLGDSLRLTGFYGMAATTITLEQYGTIGGITNDCGNTLTSGVPIFGYDAMTPSAAAAAVPCIQTQNFQAGPILITHLATGLAIPDPNGDGNLTDGMVAQSGYTNTLYVQSDANFGYVFRGGDYATLVSANLVKRYSNGNQIPVFPYQMHVYYVRPCSRPTGTGSVCQASDDSGRPIPTLVRQELDGTTLAMVERPLAEGVERVSFLYGIDTLPAPDGDGIADRFVADPLSVAGDGWARVVSVRVTLLVRTPTVIAGYDDSTKSYDLNGDGTADFTCTDVTATEPQACAYKRALFSQVIQLRNIAYRRGA
jgi:type IV pilus assembly protein PilW